MVILTFSLSFNLHTKKKYFKTQINIVDNF